MYTSAVCCPCDRNLAWRRAAVPATSPPLVDFRAVRAQIRSNEKDGLTPFDAVVEATVQRSRPVILTALAAMLAFIPLTESVFWATLAYTLIGGTFGGTVLTLLFLPALYAIWFKIKAAASDGRGVSSMQPEPVA
jgi:Cu/Ag efflux pump CusA